MAEPNKTKPETPRNQFDSGVESANTLLPMLIAGLALVIVGAVAIMMFV